jgi:hypothetical protein
LLEDSPPIIIEFDIVVGVYNWTTTALPLWIKEDPGINISKFDVLVSSLYARFCGSGGR